MQPNPQKGIIMGKPAATLTSMHICPKVTAKVPHVGGPVVVGSTNVKLVVYLRLEKGTASSVLVLLIP